MEILLRLTLGGAAVALVVGILDRCLAGRMSARSRRWWWLFVPLAFLIPFRLPLLPAIASVQAMRPALSQVMGGEMSRGHLELNAPFSPTRTVMELWLAGASAYIALVTIQTIRAARRWSQARLSTDHALLELLEDCKAEASVTAPIGLVVSDAVSSPAILGWLHPRILLPAPLVTSLPTAKLRPIILHELAHFRWLDVPFNWLLTLVRAVHWFNPLAHLGAIAWTRFREEAADEAAVRWLGDKSGQVYGDALIQLFRDPQAAGAPSGALAIAESVTQLRRRLSLIHRFPSKAPRLLLTSAISLLLGLAVFAKTTEDRTEQDARADAKAWLQKIDDGEYANAWEDLSPQWRADAPLNQWTEKLNKVRTPLGKCRQRVEISLQKEEDLRFLQSVLKGKFIAVEFRTSFENADHLGESLLISKEPDGVWRVFGYTIHP